MLNAAEQAHGYIYACLNMPEKIPLWLHAGELPSGRIAYKHGFGFNYLISGKHIYLSGEYRKLEAFCDYLKELYSRFNNQLCLIHTYTLDAISRFKNYGMPEAIDSFLKALDIAYADSILAPIAEYGIHVLPIINAVQKEELFDASYIKNLGKLCKRYVTTANAALHGSERIPSLLGSLSVREMEVLKLLAEGKTNPEIAKILYVAEITVKKTVANIYRKLGVSNRSEVIKLFQGSLYKGL